VCLKLLELVIRVTVQSPAKGKSALVLVGGSVRRCTRFIGISDAMDSDFEIIHNWCKSLNRFRVKTRMRYT
jgi:hypothetical protein